MSERPSSLTLNDNTAASNPGRLRVNYLQYARSFPLWPVVLTVALIASPLIATLFDTAAVITALVAGPIVYFLYWRRVKEHFMHGCVCPAVVVSDDPYRVAVATDLSMGVGEYPVIKILGQPLGRMTGGPPKPGKPLAAVALYEGNLGSDHWSNFSPVVVNCVSTNAAAIERVRQSIEDEEWLALKKGLAQVPRPLKPGLYRVDPL